MATQPCDILERAKIEHVLEMDTLTETADPHLGIDTARLHLDAARGPALALYRLAVTDQLANQPDSPRQDFAFLSRHPEDRQPPPQCQRAE